MKTKRVLAVHDLCSFGRCSLTAAIPVISAMGMQVCPLPTAFFSNNLTYGEFTFHDFTDKMTGFMDRWEKLGFRYDAVYSGFLASVEQIEVVRDAARRFASHEESLVVVDPAMGDDGKLYPVFGPEYVDAMRTLVKEATLITPNFTEACFLLGESCGTAVPSSEALRAMTEKLAALGAKQVVITSVPASENEIKVVSFDSVTGEYAERTTPRIPFTTCGTGDLFTSVVTGSLLRGETLAAASALAMRFVSRVMEFTLASGSDPREGVIVEPCLKELLH
jgi:pyridoxine kinase